MPSSIFPAREALYNALATTTWPDPDPQIAYGAPAAYEEQRVVAILGFGPVGDEPAAIGQRRQEETYRIEVAIKVHDPAATDGQTVETAAVALYDVVWSVVANNPTLSATVTYCFPGGGDTSEGAQPAQGGGWVMFVSLFVECHARISAA